MELSESTISILQEFLETPEKQRSLSNLTGIFWRTLIDGIIDLIHRGEDISRFLSEERPFINFGITKELFEDQERVAASIVAGQRDYRSIDIKFFDEWIADTFSKIYRADKKDLLDRDIKRLELELKQDKRECGEQQSGRRELIMNELGDSVDKRMIQTVESLVVTDGLYLQNLLTKQESAKGTFMSVEERRVCAARTMKYQEEMERAECVFSRVKSDEGKRSLRAFNTKIYELLEAWASCDARIKTKRQERAAVEHETKTLSPIEVEGRIRIELEYVRDMARLSAKRLRLAACSLLVPGAPFATFEKVVAGFDRILEFDPTLFNNDRVRLFGRPAALIVPGNGNAVYDWKNNLFVIPLVAPGGDVLASVATGVIEYRLDVDEDKLLMNSYQKIPEYKAVKSIVTLRAKMTKDYLTWMTSEYNGFKVLGKEVRAWFEREIAPKKTEIFCPLEYQPFVMSGEEVKKLAAAIESRLSHDDHPSRAEDLWGASIFAYQEGRNAEALDRLQKLLSLDPDHTFAYFNTGIIAMKTMNKPAAIAAFGEFVKRNPRSWWTSVVLDHLRRLQESG
jgi:tetratricopeptide (TPR) repeat protein